MSIYEQKNKWKFYLLAAGMLIVGISFWYTNSLASKFADKEKEQVKVWAEATKNKARLLAIANSLFSKMGDDELEKVHLWLDTYQHILGSAEFDPFVIEILLRNETVPVVLLDEKNSVISHKNIDQTIHPYIQESVVLTDSQLSEFASYPPIIFENTGSTQFIYYRDSRLFTELKSTTKDLINSFVSDIVINSASVPVIITDTSNHLIDYGNLDSTKIADSVFLQERIAEMSSENEPIEIELNKGEVQLVYYEDSPLLKQIRIYPFVQFIIIGVFVFVAYYAFSSAKKGEQNQVWVGMSKETAHQLGTPISSLVAWVEYLEATDVDSSITDEMQKDVDRLELIAERFSKIGSAPKLEKANICDVLDGVLNYMKKRKSNRVTFDLDFKRAIGVEVNLSTPLFNWVIENLINNALDAMNGEGELGVFVRVVEHKIRIDISDTGKGIPKSKHKTVFQPGYSTKRRGWGLGLSLAKRIIENYHMGKIFVAKSLINKGTTFRIILPIA